jgi:hypothetical protein
MLLQNGQLPKRKYVDNHYHISILKPENKKMVNCKASLRFKCSHKNEI